MAKQLLFQKVSNQESKNIHIWKIKHKMSGFILGEIRWSTEYGSYMFHPFVGKSFNGRFVSEISNFMEEITHKRNKEKETLKRTLNNWNFNKD